MSDCVFCKIATGEIPAIILHSDNLCIALADIAPQAPVHILIVPRTHIKSAAHVTPADGAVIAQIFTLIPEIARAAGIEDGFRVVTNCGESAGQTVNHLHFHILGGMPLGKMG